MRVELPGGYELDDYKEVPLEKIRPWRQGTGPALRDCLVARGFDCVLLANGTEHNHTPQESVAATRIIEMLAVCEEAIELAAESLQG